MQYPICRIMVSPQLDGVLVGSAERAETMFHARRLFTAQKQNDPAAFLYSREWLLRRGICFEVLENAVKIYHNTNEARNKLKGE